MSSLTQIVRQIFLLGHALVLQACVSIAEPGHVAPVGQVRVRDCLPEPQRWEQVLKALHVLHTPVAK